MSDLEPMREFRAQVDQRPERPADFICEAIGAAVAESLADGQFAGFLRDRGWILTHVGDGECLEPPGQWLQDGLDLAEPGWRDPLGRLGELWQQAWEAGRRVGAAGDAQ